MQVVQPQNIQATSAVVDESSIAFWTRMAELVPGIIYIFNHATMSNEYANCTIADLLGYSPEEVCSLGETLLPTIIHEDDQDALFDYLKSLQALPIGTETTFEYRVKSKQGNELWLRSIDSIFETSDDGAVLRHIGIAVDITAQKENEARLIEVNESLEARVEARTETLEVLNSELGVCMARRTAELNDVNRDLKDLTYVATHDLKVPINNMICLTHMLSEAEGELPPEHAETLSWMRDACHQAGEKLDALICVAQAHSGTFGVFEEVDLKSVTERALVNLHFQMMKANAVVSCDFDVQTVWFVPREMENILQSMIGNAIKYRAPERRPRVKVQSRQLENGVEVSITDNGSGVDLPRDQDKVFGLFKRAHSTPDGAGVSLYSIRRVLDRVGGSLHASSKVGKGSCFSFQLPNKPERL
ncbi:ATP-binding protein [uncultured Roseobacter sp.]|uniref:PAS domain-containing sensor histidine kinase n=1 Tax=uncultured Roseobacter sp. TaxID=114847 RepID=UPI00260F8F0E|nr:ATP-binding protein [uncultured Roseobacter sp.]